MDFRKSNREKVFRYSIRKYHFGAASVAVAALMFLGARASVVQADTTVNATEVSLESSAPKSDPAAEGTSEASTAKVDKTQLQAYYDKLTKLLAESDLQGETAENAKTLLSEVKDLLSDDKASSETVLKTEKVLETTIAEVEKALAKRTEDATATKPESSERTATPSGENREVSTDTETVAEKEKLKLEVDKLTQAVQALPTHETTTDVRSKANDVLVSGRALLDAQNVSLKDIEDMTATTKRMYLSVMNAKTRLASGRRDSRNNRRIPRGIQFRAEVAYDNGSNAEANGHSDLAILHSVAGDTDKNSAAYKVGDIMEYKIKYNRDANGKIISLDWLLYFNDHAKNLYNAYGTDEGAVYRNYFQIPKEVDMPTSITRLKYKIPDRGRLVGGRYRFDSPDGTFLHDTVTFDNPQPAKAGGLTLDNASTYSLTNGWDSVITGRGRDNLKRNMNTYFKGAASDASWETRDLLNAAAIDEVRTIWDRSTTGSNKNDAYVFRFTTTVSPATTNEQLASMKLVMGMMRSATVGANSAFINVASNPVKLWQSDIYTPTAKDQTVKVGQKPDATKSIGNLNELPQGTTVEYKNAVNTQTPGEQQAIAVVTYPDTSKKEVPVKVIVEKETALTKPVINTDLTGKAKTTDPVEVTADPGTTIELFDKDGNKIGEAVAGENGKATITPTAPIPAGNVTAKASKNGKTSEVSDRKVATPVVPEKAIAQPTKEGDKSVTVAVPASKPDTIYVTVQGKATNLRLQPDGTYNFTKNDANATLVNNPDGTVTLNLPEGKTLNAGDRIVTRTQNDDPSNRYGAVASAEDQTYPQLNQPDKVTVVNPTNLKDDEKAAVKAAVKKANPSVVESELEVDGQGNVTYKHKGAGVNVASEIATLKLTDTVERDTTAPAKPVVETDLTGKAGTKDPVEVTAEPGSTVELFDKDGNKIGEGTANDEGKATITPTKELPAGGVTAKATDPSGNVSEASEPKEATPAKDTTAPAKPEVKTDLTGKAGTKDPVEVTAEPGSKVELFDKDGNKIGEGTA
ncbi:Rib/alpha-like domain-containing protein, partial [Streptococcus sp. 79]